MDTTSVPESAQNLSVNLTGFDGKPKKAARRSSWRTNPPPAVTSSVAVKFLGHVSSDPYLNDQDVRVVVGVLSQMTADGRWRGTDEALADDTDQAPTSLHASLTRLSDRGYLAPLVRKSYGERDLTLNLRYLQAGVLRPSGASARVVVVPPVGETLGGAKSKEIPTCSRQQKTRRNSAPQQNYENKKTPDSEETLTWEHVTLRKSAGKETLWASESFCSHSSSPTHEHSLGDLAEQYGVAHFHRDVIKAADAFEDLAGSAHYNMVYTTIALSDQGVWAEAVLAVLSRWRTGEIASPRPYVATTVQGILAERNEVISDRERLGKLGLSRKVTAPPQARTDEEVAALILLDPFADAAAWGQPEKLMSAATQAAPAPAEEVAPVLAPSVERLRPNAAKKTVVKLVADEGAVLKAQQRLGSWAKLDFLCSIYTGACKGRPEVFELIVSVAERDEATSNAFLLQVADLHAAADAQLLLAIAAGKTTAECTQKLVEFEDRLEAEKADSNIPMTRMGGFRSDIPAGIGAVLGSLPLAQGDALALPNTPRAWSALQAAMTGIRWQYTVLTDADRKVCDDAGRALASARVQRDDAKWEDWRKLGTYHAACALIDAQTRAENVQASRAPVTVQVLPRGCEA